MQNVMEAAYVQHLCTELKAKGLQIILLGDFNVSQTNNEAMWNSDDDMPGGEDEDDVEEDDEEDYHSFFNQRALLQPIRDAFRAQYLRAFDEKISTNVFPFLGALTAEPAHNDDIWLPISRNPEEDKLTHTHTDGRLHSTKLVPVPANILKAWSNEATYYQCVKKGSSGNTKVPRAKITQRLAYMWSDHKPMWARVWLKPQEKGGSASAAKSKESEVAEKLGGTGGSTKDEEGHGQD
jgi:hypothetical protein